MIQAAHIVSMHLQKRLIFLLERDLKRFIEQMPPSRKYCKLTIKATLNDLKTGNQIIKVRWFAVQISHFLIFSLKWQNFQKESIIL